VEHAFAKTAEIVSEFRASRPAPAKKDEAMIVVVTADGKGVPMRRPADRTPAGCAQIERGPEVPTMKNMKGMKGSPSFPRALEPRLRVLRALHGSLAPVSLLGGQGGTP